MFGDVTNHERFEGIRGACIYLAKKKKARLNYWGEGRYEFRLGKNTLVTFTALNWLDIDTLLKLK